MPSIYNILYICVCRCAYLHCALITQGMCEMFDRQADLVRHTCSNGIAITYKNTVVAVAIVIVSDLL